MHTKKIMDDFYWVGNLDPDLRVFDIIMYTEFGTTYNSYILKGRDKTVLFEAAKAKCCGVYLEKINEIVSMEEIDYLVVNHTEPDHTGTIEEMLESNPNLTIIGTAGAVNFLKEITNREFPAQVVKAGDTLDIGGKTLEFIIAPNLHWPDTMFTYVPEIQTLVTCDCFGAHYSDENITDENLQSREDYLSAARYYYDNIMGPFRADVVRALEKIKDLDIRTIATGHGPVLIHEPREIIELYREWSAEKNPFARKTVIIPYVSAYGYTLILAEKIAEGIRSAGDIDVRLHDMVYDDFTEVMGEIDHADGFLLGTPTMVGEALPPIWNIATTVNSRVHGGKFASAFGSYGWSGEGVPNIMGRLKQTKLKVFGEGLRVRFKPNEAQLAEAYEYGRGFGCSIRDGEIIDENN